MGATDIDINTIINDDKQFKLYVALQLRNNELKTDTMQKSIDMITANGCAKAHEHAELGRRVGELEKANNFAKVTSAVMGAATGLVTSIFHGFSR
jgi:hypothetical protein